MPKKAKQSDPAGLVGAYVRKSVVKFPDDCRISAARRAYIDQLRALRVSELVADAARDGLTLDVIYDDMGISGQGEYLDKRVDFARLCRDAREGRLRVVYARDISRLSRDFVDAEQFFAEMELLGVEVRAADLPRSGKRYDTDMLRRIIASVQHRKAQEDADRIREDLYQRVKAGLWVGRTQSFFGLAYDRATHGYRLDPATLSAAVFVFETFRDCHGVGDRAAAALNRALDLRLPRATPAFRGGRWTNASVFGVIRNPVYRRVASYRAQGHEPLEVSVPHLIPESVPPELVEECLRLDAMRRPIGVAINAKIKAGRLDYTYGTALRCGFCGSRMTSRRNIDSRAGVGVRWLAWCCHAARLDNAACPESFLAQQSRVDALVGRGLREALRLAGEAWDLGGAARGRKARPPGPAAKDKDGLADALRELDRRRDSYLDLWERQVIRDPDVLRARMDRIAAERREVEALAARAGEGGDGPGPEPLTEAQWRALGARVEAAWPSGPEDSPGHDARTSDGAVPFDAAKWELLRGLGVVAHVRVLPREGLSQRQERVVAARARRMAGRTVVRLEVAALGLTGARAVVVSETAEEFEAYALWRMTPAIERRRAMMEEGTYQGRWHGHTPKHPPRTKPRKQQ